MIVVHDCRCHQWPMFSLPGNWLLILCAFFILESWVYADSTTVFEKNGPATLLIDAPLIDQAIALKLGNFLTVTLQVDGPPSLEIKVPTKRTPSPGWNLVEVSPAQTVELDEGGRRWRQSFVFEPMAVGPLPLAIQPLLIREGNKDSYEMPWKILPVHVFSGIATPDLQSIRDSTFLETPVSPAEMDNRLGKVVVVAVSLICLCGLIWWWRYRTRTMAPPEWWALRQLDRLQSLHLPRQGKVEGFHFLLANIMRRYLGKKYQLPARRRTTREFLDVLQSSPKLTEPDQEYLKDFFTRCDLAKFAREHVPEEECLARAQSARDFITGVGKTRS